MKKKQLKNYLFIYVFVIIVPSVGFSADNGYINISNPFNRKAPIAVPVLMAKSGSEQEIIISKKASNVLSGLLEYAGYFKLVTHAAFLEEPGKKGIEADKVNFRNWTVIGAEFLITGSVTEKDGDITVDFYLYDTFREQQIVAKRYRGNKENIRKITRRFGTEVIKKFTGNDGFFHSKIAFVSNGTGNKEIYSCEFDGYEPKKETNTKSIALSPAWSSDGRAMAYTSYEKGKPDIFIKNLKKGGTKLLTPLKGTNITPAWLPGSNELAASLSHEGGQGIYLLTRQGKIRKRLTRKWSEWGIDVSPSFSPNGENMVFVSKRSGTPQLFIKHLDTGRVRRLTYQGKYNTSPSWAPAGEKIAYSSAVNGRFEIFIIGLDGSEPIQLTRDSGDNESPSWSPDGSLIAFSSTREGRSRIYVMTSYGTDQRRVLFFSGEQTNPKWSPNIFNY